MIKRNKKQFTKRLISILFLIHFSYIVNKENDKFEFFEVTDEVFEEKSTFERVVPRDVPQDGEGFNDQVYMGLFDSQECLYDKLETKKFLIEKGINYNWNDNIRFLLGKCNPVVMVPGLYSTRLMLQIDCKKFKENRENLINMKLFCGESICKNDYEEHVIWPALFDSPFTLRVTEDNKFSSCFGYFFNFQNFKDECPHFKKFEENKDNFLGKPEEKVESVCFHDDSVKITFYGGSESTKSRSQCGIKSIKNIVSVGYTPIAESWVNSGAARAFEQMYDRFYEMGYRSGFSMAGVPFDFRRFISTNKEFKKILKNQVERLYNNTNKQVVIVAHSYGCLNTLDELIGDDDKFLSKIKKFIAIAPPFAGSTKAVDILLHGNKEFNTKISIKYYDLLNVELDEFSQRMVSPYSPAIYELKPNPVLFNLFSDEKYARFKDAINERIELEKKCKEIDCEPEEVIKHSQKFNELFMKKPQNKTMFPSFNYEHCKMQTLYDNPNYHQRINEFKHLGKAPYFLPCRHDIYDIVNCPTIVVKTSEYEKADIIEKLCHVKSSKNIIEKEKSQEKLLNFSNFYFNYECEENDQCLDSFIDQFSPYPYIDKKLDILIERFYNHYKEHFPDVVIDSGNFFESREDFIGKVKSMIGYHANISRTRNLDIPKVDTILIYSSFLPTKTAFLFDTKKIQNEFDNIDVLSRGGDGTVSSWSSLLVGLKWLFDKYQDKNNTLPQNIQLVEYCSLLSKSSDWLFNKNSETPQEFSVLSCDCLDSDGLYKTKETTNSQCDHSNMISDRKVLKFLEEILIDEKFENNEAVIETARNFKHDFDFENDCNSELLKITKEEI
jgi:hypothetical protein